ncbi:uncharacterized protein N7446_010808 [Penicillium canescens]|uniref:CHAT domain-containing protein n=1 Tax=Penicillium canescens TaxID=5083 RepID=A0AAD6IC27_PENCN|nr:uncharacterized protein N7446_010808 [Penicillium canescens]KAJ6041302.1 hypothetical protein N7460_006692 [Penicillium canescens]KAJ6050699.1 hypothetical protein N7446_010808 [Penicillium canescens]KAJ6065918.1 hypothetical protein N7444_001571 [Penicillium canescens]
MGSASGIATEHDEIDRTQGDVQAVLELSHGSHAADSSLITTQEAEHTSPNRKYSIKEGTVEDGSRTQYKPPVSDSSEWLPILEWALLEIPYNDPIRAQILYAIGVICMIGCATSPSPQVLGKALTYLQLATLIEPGNPQYRAQLVLALLLRHTMTDRIADLDLAITELETAMAITNEWPERLETLNLFAGVYAWRHRLTGNADDLRKSSDIMEQLYHTKPDHSPERAVISGRQEHLRTHGIDDLAIGARFDSALEITEHALNRTPSGGRTYQELLATLSRQYLHRYTQTGSSRDLDLAISRAELRLSHVLDNKAPMVGAVDGLELANHLLHRWTRHGCHADRTRALELMKKAADVAVPGSSFQIFCVIQRALWLSDLPNGADRVQALRASVEELESIRAGSVDCISPFSKRNILRMLGLQYQSLYHRTKELTDLEKAIESMENSLDITEETGQQKDHTLGILGELLIEKASWTRDNATYGRGMRCLMQSCLSDQASPRERVKSAGILVHTANHAADWEKTCLVAELIFPLMSLIGSRDLRHDDKIYNIRSISGLASNACAAFLSLGFPNEALEKIELGRGILIGDLIDIQGNLSGLEQAHPDLAQEYDRLRHEALRSIESNDPESGEQQPVNYRRAAFQRLQQCEDRIREKAGFEAFLRPLRSPEMAEISREGPIIIVNATCLTAHALLLTPSDIGHLRLDSMISHAAPQFRQHLARCALERDDRDLESDLPPEAHNKELLSWLWYSCVKPVLEMLASHRSISIGEEKSRVWWMGVGAASGLPFHAAGDYSNGTIDENENCLDRVISSYTPTVKALRNARERASKIACQPKEKHSLLIATMPDTPSHGALHGVRREAQAILNTVDQDMHVKELTTPSTDDVLAQLQSHELVHFACHGYSDPGDPAHSHLLLQKHSDSGPVVDKLTVSKLLDCQTMSRGWIAYLSACSTAEIRDKDLQDEALHITSGFLIAGFSHVISSLWPADDEVCVHMAAYFYEALIARRATATNQNRAVAEAVRDATLRIRRQYCHSPLSWALYTHMGA